MTPTARTGRTGRRSKSLRPSSPPHTPSRRSTRSTPTPRRSSSRPGVSARSYTNQLDDSETKAIASPVKKHPRWWRRYVDRAYRPSVTPDEDKETARLDHNYGIRQGIADARRHYKDMTRKVRGHRDGKIKKLEEGANRDDKKLAALKARHKSELNAESWAMYDRAVFRKEQEVAANTLCDSLLDDKKRILDEKLTLLNSKLRT